MKSEYKAVVMTLTSLALAAKLANPASAQEEDPNIQSDAQIAFQLQGARAGNQFPLDNVILGVHGRFPWVGGEADIALIQNGSGDTLGMAIQTDCAFIDSYAKDLLMPVFAPRIPGLRLRGIYQTDHRLERLDVKMTIPEEFPLFSVSEAEHLKDGETDVDCAQVGAKEDLIALAQKINRRLAPTARAGGQTIGSTIRAFIGGILERD